MTEKGDNKNGNASVEGFFDFVTERQEIWWIRQLHVDNSLDERGKPLYLSLGTVMSDGPPYPTDDLILKTGHFPNVFRELDKGTMYFRGQCDDLTPEELFQYSVVYRLLNRQRTFENYGGIPGPKNRTDFIRFLRLEHGASKPIFTNRHQVIGLGRYIEALTCLSVRGEEIAKALMVGRPLDWVHRYLRLEIPGVSGFFAWQIMCDLIEDGRFNMPENEWAYLGPGPIKAFQMITGLNVNQKEALKLMLIMYMTQHEYLEPRNFRFPPGFSEISLKNMEHSLCEYFRYIWTIWKN